MEAQILTHALDYLDRVAAQAEADYANHDRHLNRLQAAGDAHAASAAQAAGTGHSGSVQQVQAARGAAIYEIGQALGLSEGQASLRLARAARVREALPASWQAFQAGVLDAARVHVLAEAANALTRAESLHRLDAQAATYAAGRTVAQLRAWIKRRIASWEPDAQAHRTAEALQGRRVCIDHRDDGVSELWAVLPTMHAVAIDQALTRAGKRLLQQCRHGQQAGGLHNRGSTAGNDSAAGNDDTTGDNNGGAAGNDGTAPRPALPRVTLEQARADVLADVLTGGKLPRALDATATVDAGGVDAGGGSTGFRVQSGPGSTGHEGDAPATHTGEGPGVAYEPGAGLEALRDVRVDIGITIPIGTLAGTAQAPGTAPDGSWTLPADQVRELALSPAGGQVFWHRLLIDDSDDGGGEVLSHTYAGRFPPRVLQAALRFRDGTCSVPGCRVPAADCDTDHRTAWPAGPTRASNLWSLCRRHHRWKTLGIIEPVRTSDDGSSDSHSTSNPVRWGWVLPSGRVVRVEPVDHRPIAETPPSTYTGIDSLPVGLAGEVLGEFPDAFPPRGPASGRHGMPLDEDFWDEGSWEDGPPPPRDLDVLPPVPVACITATVPGSATVTGTPAPAQMHA
ncbi:HNH endonuclease signature motif containing protein [Sediminivirga luteola]|uniref:HNH nuclease domain-containing protein n=3 Tax=Sediminivirga luteola TaxID=1774748 RepID=A0A8J2XKA0_9MICO|nr:hypothetical protein GCM10011333_13610 [Sediminivirga luteola]